MNNLEESYFLALSQDRSEIADVLDRRSVRGYKESVVEKYSDQAHFIYELLQNADDTFATKARFILEEDRLIFGHNGTRHFSVSNPAEEDIDTDNGVLGDINAITSIANSNKTKASIGKFGVGFKAVFQYTATPHIFDPDFKFKIERFIVPIKLSEDYLGRKADETLFVFPFNHPERSKTAAYQDISFKLRNLSYPLLFLTSLQEIEFQINNFHGKYGKSITEEIENDSTKAEKIVLTQQFFNNEKKDELWLFSRLDEEERRYSVGYFLDENGALRPVGEPAFCFFPTKEVTHLKFIIHAPFLLTDSREGIRAGVKHNENMIKKLADLSADALEYLNYIGIRNGKRLIDDNIVRIIPIDPDNFDDDSKRHRISFRPFFDAIKKRFEEGKLIPTADDYVLPKDAYWASVTQLPKLFSNEQLGEITGNKNAQWAFISIGRDEVQRNNKALFNYIEDLMNTNLNEDVVLNGRTRNFYYYRESGTNKALKPVTGISKSFIETQSIEWLHKFYNWISETNHRTEIILQKEIFLDQNGEAAAAYNNEGKHILFLPVKDIQGYKYVNEALLTNTKTLDFIKSIGIKKPSLKDQIYSVILPQYSQRNNRLDIKTHFMIFFQYFCECSYEDVDEFIDSIKDYGFLLSYRTNTDGVYRKKADNLYMPTENLIRYFSNTPSALFVDLETYKSMVGKDREKQLISFLKKLGVKSFPSITVKEFNGHRSYKHEEYIDGLLDIIDKVEEEKDADLSLFLWNQLCELIDNDILTFSILLRKVAERPDGRYKFKPTRESSTTAKALLEKKWLVTNGDKFASANELTKSQLSIMYNFQKRGASQLLTLLKIPDSIPEQKEKNIIVDDSNLTESQRKDVLFGRKLKAHGINEGNIDQILEILDQQKMNEQKQKEENVLNNESVSIKGKRTDHQTNRNEITESLEDILEDLDEDLVSNQMGKVTIGQVKSSVIKEITRKTREKPKSSMSDNLFEDGEDEDEDEYMPVTVDYGKKIERAKQKSAADINRIVNFENLQLKALSSEKYSYSWFSTLLEMESLNSGEANSKSREVSLTFGKVEREPGTKRTLVLKYPSQYIPQFLEDLADIPLVLHTGDQSKTLVIEVASVKSYTLRVKVKYEHVLDNIDLNSVTSATIDAKSPVFLIEELRKQFAKLEFADDFNMQQNLCENIEFIFGPPGTGKTTYLARNKILPIMKNNPECKVLVLTPTNKSADVLVKKIMEVSGEDSSYNDWLIRFGSTGDESIEESPVFKEKTFDIRKLKRSVTVTTIARFPYDFFMPGGQRIFLQDIEWDCIIVDEASMIPLVNIIYPLYKQKPKIFIIAGDPFQIEPITSVDLWKNENIYTMVHLDSFTQPHTIPHPYKVHFLKTQYRSVPDIGNIFSEFSYGGILEHYRSADSRAELNVGDDLGIETINVIKFPVSKYESIYRSKRLNGSSYQVYSALFTFEYVCYLARAIAENNPGKSFSIGIIAPYRAEADMIEKLLAFENLPKEIDVQVGTVHGFQGDECDIILAVFNAPSSISKSKDMFLNKKNIINVSISRARDYLFLIMPDDKTEKVNNLTCIKRIEQLIHKTDVWNEFNSSDLEDLIFDDPKFLEKNTFSTTHQSVNVYGLPEKKYEVRTEDTAVDVQIHKKSHEPEQARKVQEPVALNIDRIPEKLRRNAIMMTAEGEVNGKCYLVPFSGSLGQYTKKKCQAMFIPQKKNNKEKLLCVYVDVYDRIVFISATTFNIHQNSLLLDKKINLRT